jgi:hypothetical protein
LPNVKVAGKGKVAGGVPLRSCLMQLSSKVVDHGIYFLVIIFCDEYPMHCDQATLQSPDGCSGSNL